jgi:TorA maturation chaperone TorD
MVGEKLQRLRRHLVERRMQLEKTQDIARDPAATLLPQIRSIAAIGHFLRAHDTLACSSKFVV